MNLVIHDKRIKYFTLCAFFISFLASCTCEKEVITLERIRVRDTTLYIAGAVVRDTVTECDSIEWERVVHDTSGIVSLHWYRNAYGRLMAECSAKPRTITITVTDTNTVTKYIQIDCSECTKGSFFQTYGKIMFAIGIALLIILGIYITKKFII